MEGRELRAEALDFVWPQIERRLRYVARKHYAAGDEDVLQEALRKFLACSTPLQSVLPGQIASQIEDAMHSVATDAFRGRQRKPSIPLDDVEPNFLAKPGHDEAEALDVRRFLSSLPNEVRAIVIGKHIDDLRWSDLVEQLQLSQSTVIRRNNDALALLRDMFPTSSVNVSERVFVTDFLRRAPIRGDGHAMHAECEKAMKIALERAPGDYAGIKLLLSAYAARLSSLPPPFILKWSHGELLSARLRESDPHLLGAAGQLQLATEARFVVDPVFQARATWVTFKRAVTGGKTQEAVDIARHALDLHLFESHTEKLTEVFDVLLSCRELRPSDRYLAHLTQPQLLPCGPYLDCEHYAIRDECLGDRLTFEDADYLGGIRKYFLSTITHAQPSGAVYLRAKTKLAYATLWALAVGFSPSEVSGAACRSPIGRKLLREVFWELASAVQPHLQPFSPQEVLAYSEALLYLGRGLSILGLHKAAVACFATGHLVLLDSDRRSVLGRMIRRELVDAENECPLPRTRRSVLPYGEDRR